MVRLLPEPVIMPNSPGVAGARVPGGENDKALHSARETGEALLEGIRGAARRQGIRLPVTGFGAAFALHFSAATELLNYQDTLNSDGSRLSRFLLAVNAEGVNPLPDGRMYVSVTGRPEEHP